MARITILGVFSVDFLLCDIFEDVGAPHQLDNTENQLQHPFQVFLLPQFLKEEKKRDVSTKKKKKRVGKK